jgi:hypothetical protein
MAALLAEPMCVGAWPLALVPLSVRHAITTAPHADIPLSALLLSLFAERSRGARSVTQVDEASGVVASSYSTYPP